jgi:hypothetical protein
LWVKSAVLTVGRPLPIYPRYPRKLIPPLHGAQLKNEQDVHLFERLAFLSRREV